MPRTSSTATSSLCLNAPV